MEFNEYICNDVYVVERFVTHHEGATVALELKNTRCSLHEDVSVLEVFKACGHSVDSSLSSTERS